MSQLLVNTRLSSRPAALRAAAVPLLVSIAVLIAAYFLSPNFRTTAPASNAPFGGDFLQEWLGGHIVRSGDHARFYDASYAKELQHDPSLIGFSWSTQYYFPIVYPPFYYVAISPLSALPFTAAAWLWAVLMLTCFAATVGILQSATRGASGALAKVRTSARHFDWQGRLPWLLPAAVLFVPLLNSLTTSQKGTVCLLILTATFVLLDRQRTFWAGVVFGLLAFKPQLTLVIALAMLCKRQWSFVAGGLTTGTVLGGLSLILGTDVCLQYVRFSTGAADYIQTGGYDLHASHCFYGFFALLSGESLTFARFATATAGLATLGLIGWMLRGRLHFGSPRFAVQFSGLVIATVLISPHLFTYDLTILLLPMYLLVVCAVARSRECVTARRLLWLIAGLYFCCAISPGIAASTGVQLTTIVMGGLLVLAARLARSVSEVHHNGPRD